MAELPCDLTIESPDGQMQALLKKGASLPAEARAVFATQKAGERELALRLHEGGPKPKLIGDVRCELPPGLPPNTWLAVFVRVGDGLDLALEVKENLRRLRLTPTVDTARAKSKRFHVRGG